jgi:hypothetical protein
MWCVGSRVVTRACGAYRWHAVKASPPKDVFRPANSTDVTRREGRSLVDYYGTYTLMGMS